jgi:hypothetical protein
MSLKIFDTESDKVIESFVGTGKTTYGYALEKLLPLTTRFDAQRKLQDKKFYKRLQRDIVKGCLMPPITIAFVDKSGVDLSNRKQFEDFVNSNIDSGYILDGLQRLNTLLSASDIEGFDAERPIHLNVIVSPSQDKLLYRMITLNNGQKPMTPRHQVEILTQEMFSFTGLANVTVQTEKERSEKIVRGAFNLSDISNAYLAFLTNNVNNENNKIVNEKMDEILVGRVLDTDIADGSVQFEDVLVLLDRLCESPEIRRWFKVNNNLIGFCVAIKKTYPLISEIDLDDFKNSVQIFEESFDAINASKVNLGKYRRQLSKEFFEKFEALSDKTSEELTEYFAEITS